ncbi:MAG: sugar ABC transporter ATP-binding protein, partial [Lachnospiraceae bacterium]|nr:sugar ABC transporter ATP-binding protein [Lachnospiraceae bacterium]
MQIAQGEILGLLAVNGHGMPALLKLLETNLPLDDGYVYYGGELVNSWKMSGRTTNRISVIGAENRLVESLSVTDNIFVLRQGFRQEVIRTGLLEKQLKPFLEDIGMDIPMDIPVEKLHVFERVVLELLRAVVFGHHLIVLNEIGTLISAEELKKLHEILRHYASVGFSFLYICPHYEEVEQICGRCALLSHGRILKVVEGSGATDEILRIYDAEYAQMIRGRLERQKGLPKEKKVALMFSGLSGEHIKSLSMSVYAGECLSVQILDNDSFLELCGFLTENKKPLSGAIRINSRKERVSGGNRIGRRKGHTFSDRRVAVLVEQATKTMVFPELSYMENLCISLSMRMPAFWRKAKLRRSIRQEYGPILGEEVFDLPVEELSERQKYQMIYTRILLAHPEVVFCIHPFKGADLPHRMFIWKMLEMLLDHGIAVVILSLSLSDSLSLADRLLIVGQDETKEILRENFASISELVPWGYLYREEMRLTCNFEPFSH